MVQTAADGGLDDHRWCVDEWTDLTCVFDIESVPGC